MTRLAVLALLVVFVGVATGGVAASHTELRSALPAPGATVGGTVDQVRLEFTDPISAEDATIDLVDPDQDPVPPLNDTELSDDGRVLRRSFEALERPGEYRVDWVALSSDGDRQESAYVFEFDPAAAPPEIPGSDDAERSDPLVAVAVAVVVAAAFAVGYGIHRRRVRG